MKRNIIKLMVAFTVGLLSLNSINVYAIEIDKEGSEENQTVIKELKEQISHNEGIEPKHELIGNIEIPFVPKYSGMIDSSEIQKKPEINDILDYTDGKLEGLLRPDGSIEFVEGIVIKNDFNEDFRLDIQDLAILAGSYNKYEGDESWNSKLDINEDKIIDMFDMVILSKAL